MAAVKNKKIEKYPINTMNKTEYFQKMYNAHDIIADIRDKINRLYQSAIYINLENNDMPKSQLNPQKFENTIIEMADLKTFGKNLLQQRAKFDLFVCSLNTKEEKILRMRCEYNMSWKEIAKELKIAVSTAKEIFYRIENKADIFGCFYSFQTENDSQNT